jgi:hypothetical protein
VINGVCYLRCKCKVLLHENIAMKMANKIRHISILKGSVWKSVITFFLLQMLDALPKTCVESEIESESDDDIASFFERSTSKRRFPTSLLSSKPSEDGVDGAEPTPGQLWYHTLASSSHTHSPEQSQLITGDESKIAKRQCTGIGIGVGVERPLTFRGHNVSYEHESRSRADFKAMDWYYSVLDRYLEVGYSNDQLVSMFRSIPDELGSVLKQGLQAFQFLRASQTNTSTMHHPPPAEIDQTDTCAAVLEGGQHGEKDIGGHLNISWDPVMQVSAQAVRAAAHTRPSLPNAPSPPPSSPRTLSLSLTTPAPPLIAIAALRSPALPHTHTRLHPPTPRACPCPADAALSPSNWEKEKGAGGGLGPSAS